MVSQAQRNQKRNHPRTPAPAYLIFTNAISLSVAPPDPTAPPTQCHAMIHTRNHRIQAQWTPTCLAICASGFGVRRLAARPGSGIRSAILSLMSSMSGDTERTGYSFAGEVARRSREVVGCGDRMVGDWDEVGETSSTTVVGTGWAVTGRAAASAPGPVRMLDGRICSKPWERATVSIDLKYYSQPGQPPGRMSRLRKKKKKKNHRVSLLP